MTPFFIVVTLSCLFWSLFFLQGSHRREGLCFAFTTMLLLQGGAAFLPDMATYVMCVCQRVDAESSGCPEGGAVRGPLRNMCGTCRPEICWVRHVRNRVQQLLGALVFLRSCSIVLCTRPPH